MIKNNVYYEWFASITVPNPDQVGYWVDLGADSKGRIIKVYNRDIEKWVVLFDVSKDDYVPPFIGSNGNWWVDNRDTGIKATAETPYIGENDHWFTYDPINKVYVDTGIEARGLSAYDIAVKLGFEGSEQDWIDSLSKASEDAAVAALDAANKANEAADKANQAVTDIEGIVDDAIAATDKAEEILKTNEANRVSAESSRASAETLRASAEAERNTNEQKRIEEETKRISSEEGRVAAETERVDNEDARIAAETTRDTAEQERVSNEATRQANEAIRETQEAAREKNTADAITAVNEAKTAAQQATTNATTAANNANTQANRAKEYADNPPKVGDDGYWYLWDEVDDVYVNTGWPSSGIILKGSLDSPEDLDTIVDTQLSDSYIVGTDLYFWNGTEWVNMGRFQGPQGEPGKDAELSKAAIEAVLVGEVTTHTHDTRYYTKDQTDANIKVVSDDLANNYYNKSQVDSKFTSVYIFKGSVDSVEDLPIEGNVIGDVWNVRRNDTNYAWTSEGWDALGGTAELASATANGLMSKEDFNKLQAIEAGAQVNKIESITKRVPLNVVNKNVTIPEDIKVSETEPTEEEIMWLDPTENYDFTFDGYSQTQADELFVKKEQGKGLSTNDYTNTDKTKVTNLTDYVTGGTGAVSDANAATITLAKKNPTTGAASTNTVVINKATTTTAGVMSAADKTKLDGLSNYNDTTIKSDIANLKSNKLETVEVTGAGNVITTVTKNGTKIAFAKGITAMTQDTSDARYVKKTGDTMSGRLNIKTPASTGFTLRLAKETSDTPENDEIFVRMDIDDNNKGSFGYHNTHGTTMYNYGSSSRFHIANDGELKYLTNGVDGKVWHAGNDGSGSGLDADLLDGYHGPGLELNSIKRYCKVGNVSSSLSSYNVKFASCTLPNGAVDSNITFYVEDCYSELNKNLFTRSGILQVRIRQNTNSNETITASHPSLKWLLNNGVNTSDFKMYIDDNNKCVELWCNVLGPWNTVKFTVLSEGDRNSSKDKGLWMLYNNLGFTENQTTTLVEYIESTNAPIYNVQNEDSLAYWYENNENASSTTCLTGGNRNVIESLRSKFKRCIAMPSGDDAALISYCNEENSSKWPDGTNITIMNNHQNRMVYFPKYYHKTIERSPGIWRTYISEQQIDGDYIEEPEMLLGSFEGAINVEGMLISTASQTSTASKTMAEFVTAAKTHGSLWGIGDYRSHATIARMFCAYYGTTNISTSNSAIPCSGGTKRYDHGLTGATVPLGNADGKVAVTNDTGYYSTNFLGLEDCYYSKWEFVQGINILKGKYVVYDGGSFPDKDVAELEAAGATNIRVAGYEPNPAATGTYNGWIKAVAQGKYGDVVPTAHGGSETTYYSDYSWFNPTGNRIFLRSGSSGSGSRCGVFMAHAANASSASWTYIGARLAFYGKIVVVDSDTFKKMQA